MPMISRLRPVDRGPREAVMVRTTCGASSTWVPHGFAMVVLHRILRQRHGEGLAYMPTVFEHPGGLTPEIGQWNFRRSIIVYITRANDLGL